MTVETQENVTAFNKQLLMMLGKERLSESSYSLQPGFLLSCSLLVIPDLFDNLQTHMHAWGKTGTIDPFKNVYTVRGF